MTCNSGNQQNRREFLGRAVPACALVCLGCRDLFASTLGAAQDSTMQAADGFEEELTLTYKKLFEYRYKANFIPVFEAIADDIGREKTLELLKKASAKNNRDLGERLAQSRPSNDFHTFAEPFRNPRGVFKHANVYDVVEDTKTAFGIRVRDCLSARVFHESGAADLGYAAICHADYALPQGFNPNITLVRDKTLMQGHDCCNHRYLWQE